MRVQPRSLAARLTLSSAIVLPLILAFSAFSLDRAFRHSLIKAEQQALRAQLYSLLGAAEPDSANQQLYLPNNFAEPRFNRPQSGLYGWVLDANGNSIWHSMSAPDVTLPPQLAELFDAGTEKFLSLELLDREHFALSLDTLWEVDGSDHLFRFIVIHDQKELQQELKSYRDALWLWLGGIALLFLFAQLMITRWGLKPLKALAEELKVFQQGHKSSIEGEYPAEISPVIDNLNDVLDSEQAQRQRYKNTLSDLAHSLKTPLAIIRAELVNSRSAGGAIDEQVNRMADIVQHQLQRATLNSTRSVREKTALNAAIERLGTALSKVYREKNVNLTLDIPAGIHFPGDESDALELFGNVLENAFKYGKRQVKVAAQKAEGILSVSISDDGPGIADSMKQKILARGARADTSIQGQGIGLSIVVDILSSYRGQLEIGDSSLGGAQFNLIIPE